MASEKQLKKAAEELNDVLGIEPPISMDFDIDVIEEKIKEAIKELITPEDEFTEDTQAVIDELSAPPAKKPVAKRKVAAPEPEPEEDPEPEEKPAKKAPAVKKESTVTKERFAAKKSTGADRVAFFTPLIKKGTYTKAELVELGKEEFPDVSASTLLTMLTDGKNPKYNKFAQLIVQTDAGILKFQK